MNRSRPTAPPVYLVAPGPIETLTGGFIYDRNIANFLRRAGRLGELVCLEGDYPRPTPAALEADAERLAGLPQDGPLVIDGLALTALLEPSTTLTRHHGLLALIHHPLCDETGFSPSEANQLFQAERRALMHTSGCIVTSPATGRRLADFDIPPDRVRVVIPGLDPVTSEQTRSPAADKPIRLLCVATLTPRKGQDILLAALADLRDLDWRLDLVGAARDADFADKIKSMVDALDLGDRVHFHGEVAAEQLAAHYANAEFFVLPSHHEGFGMALTEAMAHGLAIISTRAGAIPETVPAGAGELIPPGDAPALAASLRRFITDTGARTRAGIAARQVALRLSNWAETGAAFLAAVDDLSRSQARDGLIR
jgi:glycosyltransferase involved in cell wall biosynthesis